MKRKASDNRYDGLVEPWKVQLLVSRARRLGFRRHELEDVQQEVILEVIAFPFDPSKGASESTPLTAMIDNRLKALRRKARRYAARITSVGDAPGLEEAGLTCEDEAGLRMDMLSAMALLTPNELAICAGLIRGQSVNQIALRLNRSWHTVHRMIHAIRRRFLAMGLEA
jgi:DNA-directed RNA polymerase specialized sigma24 family protein